MAEDDVGIEEADADLGPDVAAALVAQRVPARPTAASVHDRLGGPHPADRPALSSPTQNAAR